MDKSSVFCSPVEMGDEIVSQGLTQVKTKKKLYPSVTKLFTAIILMNMLHMMSSVCPELRQQRTCSSSRNIYPRDIAGS